MDWLFRNIILHRISFWRRMREGENLASKELQGMAERKIFFRDNITNQITQNS